MNDSPLSHLRILARLAYKSAQAVSVFKHCLVDSAPRRYNYEGKEQRGVRNRTLHNNIRIISNTHFQYT